MATINQTPRIFRVENKGTKVDLPDPNPKMTIQEVKKFYLDEYPQLINCRGHETNIEGTSQVITFKTVFGDKG